MTDRDRCEDFCVGGDVKSKYKRCVHCVRTHAGVTDRDRCEDFAWAVMSEMTRMCYDVPEGEVARAKNQMKASLMFLQDSSHREWGRVGVWAWAWFVGACVWGPVCVLGGLCVC